VDKIDCIECISLIKCLIIATIIVLLLVVQGRATLRNDPSGLQGFAK